MARARSASDIPFPAIPWLIWWFWQKTHRRLQEEKKTVPAPAVPERGGSSPKWGSTAAT